MSSVMLSRYDAYKESGVEWLGNVPAHWDVARVKEVSEINKKNLSEKTAVEYEFDYVDIGSVFYGVKEYLKEKMTFGMAPSRAKRIVSNGDTIISTVRTYLKAVALIDEDVSDLIVSTGFAVVSPKKEINNKYCSYQLTSEFVIDKISKLSSGVSYPATNASVIGDLLLLIPPFSEQVAIANYLDNKTAQIDRQIDLFIQKAAQYGKLKQSLINETVTRGLDKTVLMKDSGVEWIGEVPAHWELKRVKEVSTVINGATPKSSAAENWDGDLPWVTPDDLGKLDTKFIVGTKRKITEKGYASCGTTICPVGSVVISGRAPIGHIGILSIKASTNQGCKTLVLKHKVANNLFVFYSLLSSKLMLEALGRGTTFIELSTKELGLFNLPLPSLPEQQALANYLDEKTAKIDQVVSTINTQINKLKELRKTLINDVVTGKIKVA